MPADTSHECFPQPTDRNIAVWRYMNFARLNDLLVTQSLWYARLDQLGDPFEGSYPASHKLLLEKREAFFRSQGHEIIDDGGRLANSMQAITYVNCWCSHASESNALWRIYGGSDGGVAVRTTYARLCDSLPDKCMIGLVRYLNYDRDSIPWGNTLQPGMHKREMFAYEAEVRAVQWETDILSTPVTSTPLGLRIPINLENAIEAIVVSPYAPSWALEITSALVQKCGFKIPVVASSMMAAPVRDRMINPLPPGLRMTPTPHDGPRSLPVFSDW